jgi:hypothetical protein
MIERMILWMLAAYKRVLSPWLPVACRYTPTCSEYAAEAVARHGAWRGVVLALWRLSRCQPFGGRGLDPVPERFAGSHGHVGCTELHSEDLQQKAPLAEAGRVCIGR